MKNLFVSDITLRVAAEELGHVISFREKLNIAGLLQQTGVNSIELPFVKSGKEDTVVYRTIAESVSCGVCIPCDSEEAIQAAVACVKANKNTVIQICVPISTVQMEYTYHIKAPKMLEKIAALCKLASAVCDNVELVARDATRAEAGFAVECAKTAYQSGANAVTVCDDGGFCFPDEFAKLIKEIKTLDMGPVYVQPSDKLQFAAACAVAAIIAGADGVKTSAVGEEYLKTDVIADIIRAKGAALGVNSNLDVTSIHNIVSGVTATDKTDIIKSNTADTATLVNDCTLADITAKIADLGYELSDADNGKVYDEFKRVTTKKGAIGSRELEAIIASTAMQVPSTYHLINYVVNSGNIISATANITLEKDGETLTGVSIGDGPIDAAFHAIEQIVGFHYELDDFQIQAVTKGREAIGSSLIRLRADGKLYSGNGVSTDIIGACIRAYINALNKIVYGEN